MTPEQISLTKIIQLNLDQRKMASKKKNKRKKAKYREKKRRETRQSGGIAERTMAILYRTKYINNNYPLAGELRIPCTYIWIGLLVQALPR